MKLRTAAATLAAMLSPLPAAAACQLSTVEVPVTMEGLRPIVTAKVAERPVRFIVDSGAFFSHLNPSVAAELKLKPVADIPTGSHLPADRTIRTSGVAGRAVTTGIVTAPSFEFAGSSMPRVQFLSTTELREAGGLIGQNVLHLADVEYDLKNGMLRLVRPADCAQTNMAYWAKPGMSYSVAPLEETGRYEVTSATIEVNGVKMRAVFDTGAATSFITARAAARAGVKTSDPNVRPSGVTHGMDRTAVKTWIAPFAHIKMGDEEVRNIQLSIGETPTTSFDVLIGADFFLAHRVYVANSQNRIYFTYNGGRVFRAAQGAAAGAP